MINLNLLYFLNLFSTGLLFMTGIAVLFTGHKTLKPAIHSIYWFINFCASLFYNLEFTGTLKIGFSPSSFLYMIIPLLMLVYITIVLHQKLSVKIIITLVILIPFIALKETIMLFQMFYSITILIGIVVYSIFININNKNQIKKNIYIFLWCQLSTIGYIPYIIVNIILSLMKKYPIHLQGILPFCISISALLIYFLYYRFSQFYTNEDVKENHIREKMSLIEKIAASIVHEIKNPVAAIQSLNEQLLERHSSMSNESIEKYHTIIDKDIKRIKTLADTFLNTFKDKESENDNEIDIFITFQSIIDLIRFDLLKKEVNFSVDKNLIGITIRINNYYFRQIFLNLIYNSIEANAKNISIYAEKSGSDTKIYIKDDGEGIKIQNISKVFIPFFTTKSEGTGLGLSICQKIIEKYNGEIKLISSGKEGTLFCVLLRNNG